MADKMFNSDRSGDPLLFLGNDKSDLDNFLLTSGDMERINNDDLQIHVNDDNSLDFNSLEGNGQLGDVNWLHNASLAALTQFDNDDTSDGSNMISVNPQSVIPMQIIEPSKPDNLMSSENANSAAMRLHANCSNLIGADSPEDKKSTTNSTTILNQDHPSIRILSVASSMDAVHSPKKQTSYIITNPAQSPLKSQTYVLNTANGVLTPEPSVSYRTVPSTAGNIVIASPQKLHSLGSDKIGRVVLKAGLSPSQASPVLLGHLQTGVQQPPQMFQNAQIVSTNAITTTQTQPSDTATVSSTTTYGEDKAYPKPVFSYSCLIALALKNSKNGSLPVSEIYNFMCENFPYFKTAPDGWKNSVRHNLSLNKCFAKVDNPKMSQGAKKGCLWALNPAKVTKMEEEIAKWGKKDPVGLLTSMAYPENLELIEKGLAGLHYAERLSKASAPDPVTPIKTEATPVKSEYSPVVNYDFRPISVDTSLGQGRATIPVPIQPVPQHVTPVKSKPQSRPHARVHPYSSTVQRPNRTHTSSPMTNIDVYNQHSPARPVSTADPGTKALSINDIHSTINTDALTDIVLQNGMWESEDLENEIDIDLICDSPSSQLLIPIHSPLPSGSSPLTVQTSALNSGYSSPSINNPYPTSLVQVTRPQQAPHSPHLHIMQQQHQQHSPSSSTHHSLSSPHHSSSSSVHQVSLHSRQHHHHHPQQQHSPLSHLIQTQAQSPLSLPLSLSQSSPNPVSVRNNLFGAVNNTPTRRTLYT